jgi:hypothetical protein
LSSHSFASASNCWKLKVERFGSAVLGNRLVTINNFTYTNPNLVPQKEA